MFSGLCCRFLSRIVTADISHHLFISGRRGLCAGCGVWADVFVCCLRLFGQDFRIVAELWSLGFHQSTDGLVCWLYAFDVPDFASCILALLDDLSSISGLCVELELLTHFWKLGCQSKLWLCPLQRQLCAVLFYLCKCIKWLFHNGKKREQDKMWQLPETAAILKLLRKWNVWFFVDTIVQSGRKNSFIKCRWHGIFFFCHWHFCLNCRHDEDDRNSTCSSCCSCLAAALKYRDRPARKQFWAKSLEEQASPKPKVVEPVRDGTVIHLMTTGSMMTPLKWQDGAWKVWNLQKHYILSPSVSLPVEITTQFWGTIRHLASEVFVLYISA